MKTKHTPGPWVFKEKERTPKECPYRIYSKPTGRRRQRIVALSVTDNAGARAKGGNTRANARLIAAAPDLKMWAEDLVKRLKNVRLDPDTSDTVMMLRKAIAKAEGGGE